MNTIKRCQPLLGTFVEITLTGSAGPEKLHRHAGKAFEMIRSVQRMMSFHDADSDISRLNCCGHLAPLQVHPWTYHVLEQAVQLSQETEGAFDITVAPRLVSSGLLPRHGSQTSLAEAGRWEDIVLHGGRAVSFRRPLQLDLGVVALGGGRQRPSDSIDHGVGISGFKPLGTRVAKGEPIAFVQANDEASAAKTAKTVAECYRISETKPAETPVIGLRIGAA